MLSGGADASRDVSAWPGKVVEAHIDDAALRQVLECWLVRMARAGGKVGKDAAAAASPNANAGALSGTVAKLMRPPYSSTLLKAGLNVSVILQVCLLPPRPPRLPADPIPTSLPPRPRVTPWICHVSTIATCPPLPRVLPQALLERHHEVISSAPPEVLEAMDAGGELHDEQALHAAATLSDVHSCMELLLGAMPLEELMPTWKAADSDKATPPVALAGTARAFSTKLWANEAAFIARRDGTQPPSPGGDSAGLRRVAFDAADDAAVDASNEKVLLALVSLFVEDPNRLTGFQKLVPRVFDAYLALNTPLRQELASKLAAGGTEAQLVKRIETDDELVRQPFFWSAPGMKLFGRHPDLADPVKLKALLEDALAQQPIIVASFLEDAINQTPPAEAPAPAVAAPDAPKKGKSKGNLSADAKKEDDADGAAPAADEKITLPKLVGTVLAAVLAHAAKDDKVENVRKGVIMVVEHIFVRAAVERAVYDAAIEALATSDVASPLLAHYAEHLLKPRLDAAGDSGADERDTAILNVLVALFIERPESYGAFCALAPKVFESLLKLGSPARVRFNEWLLTTAGFEPRLEKLIASTDEIVTADFFWNAEVMPLCTKAKIAADYAELNKASMTHDKTGEEVHLYSRLLALLLRLSARRGGEVAEIAKRTREVLDQFERNPEQAQFMLTIIEKLDERSLAAPDDFAEIELTVLSEVAANGVQTITSVQGDGLALCEKAMTTLLQSYLAERAPSEWKGLFKEATNIAFMVKYMFRESLELAKDKFNASIGNRRQRGSADEVEAVGKLVEQTLTAYGNVGIYDPAKLADIDFLNKPELLVDLVSGSRHRESRVMKPDMQLLTEVTTKWMQLMVDKKYPPLTPHHTQAFTVLMMCKFFALHLEDDLGADPKKKKKKPKYRTFIAQMSTGEGKSIVIAMLAIFMVRLYGVKVHVLENNAGLLQRDFKQNQPFYDKFGIKSGISLDEPDSQIVYCLKDAINRRFLRKMVEGKLDEELANTVLIVDEVDDLIVNERPNAHYVKRDAERTPALIKCFQSLAKAKERESAQMPDGVPDDIWHYANEVVKFTATREVNKHYRIIESAEGKKSVLQLDPSGNVPKVKLASPWLNWLDYKLCGVEPFSETRWACVCTPYMFNKYKGIFGLTGSVGGKAELKYLANTYKAVKFDVPRFLDTCHGNARKEVTNHGVELHAGGAKQLTRVCELAGQYFKKVPVLIITTGPDQIKKVLDALKEGPEAKEAGIPPEEVQRLSQFDERGRSLSKEWQSVIEDATRRLGGTADSRCRVTVTDKFGGRGHDFQVVDKESNANGGMLVIATSIPDEREWIQWKGRTARQDRPGQFYVILDETATPFKEPNHKGLAAKIKKMAAAPPKPPAKDGTEAIKPQDTCVELLLDVADEGIGERLKKFEGEQATGEKLNELTELYYKEHPRSFDDVWPQQQYLETDGKLRRLLTEETEALPAEVKRLAKEELKITLD